MTPKTEIIESITSFLFIGQKPDDLNPSDLVIVLGNYFAKQTMEEVADLYNHGIIVDSAKIILSGATGKANSGQRNECDQMYEAAVNEYHMPKDIFVKESKATNAQENLLFSKEIIISRGGFGPFKSILFVGNAFMMRRVSMYASKLEYPTEKLQYYGVVDKLGRNVGPDTWWNTENGCNRVMAELERIGVYYKNGDLGIF